MKFYFKIMATPLFISLLVLWFVMLFVVKKHWSNGLFEKGILSAGVFALFFLTVMSTPNASRFLHDSIEDKNFFVVNCSENSTVVVLNGGMSGVDLKGNGFLTPETMRRVERGAEVFDECKAQKIILSGKSQYGNKEQEGLKMRDILLQKGVPIEKITIESDSINTREHPLMLKKNELVSKDANLIIVTSPWHVKRALREFKKSYSNATAISTRPRSFSNNYFSSLSSWLPQAVALDRTTRVFREYLGMLWYDLQGRE